MSELAPQAFRITRADLVRYAGASGDFNPIHWSGRVATGVGLPGVIAHGMLTMALAGSAVAAWLGDATRIRCFGVRFSGQVVVPYGAQVDLETRGVVVAVDEAGDARIDLTVTCAGAGVLERAYVTVCPGSSGTRSAGVEIRSTRAEER
jgi:acyl dehydratase